ncbi:hypothetical protein [Agrococcus versicolor]
MDDRRAALLVAGIALVVLGLVTTTLARGTVLGIASVTVGVLLAVSAGTRWIVAARARPPRSSGPFGEERERAVPGISFWRWGSRCGWGTTPWGVGARVILFALLAGAAAIVPDLSVEVPPWTGLVTVLVVNTLLFVPAWVIERLTRPGHILPRGVDLAIVLPAAGIWFAVVVALQMGAGREWASAIAVVLLIGGVVAAVLLARSERRSADEQGLDESTAADSQP